MSDQQNENSSESIMDKAQQATDLPAELLRTEIEQVSAFYKLVVNFFTNYSFQLLGALLILLIGYFVAGKISKAILRLCEKKQLTAVKIK